MNTYRLTGILLIAGFVFVVLGAMAAPSDAYQGDDLDARLNVISANQSQWNLSKVFDALGVALPGIAFFLLARHLAASQSNPALARLAGGILLLSSITGAYYAYRLAVTPKEMWIAGFPEPLSFSVVLSYLIGFLLLTFVISDHIFPAWLFYLSASAASLGLVAAVVFRTTSPFFLFALLSMLNVVIGIVLVRGARRQFSP